MQAEYTLGLDPDGREHVVVVVKGTYVLSVDNQEFYRFAKPAKEQLPLTMADEYQGEPGFSSVVRESDFAPKKQKCDVLFNGCAYAPYGDPTRHVTVRIQVGEMDKQFVVHGPRTWMNGFPGVLPSTAEAFVKTPFSYDTAYGGVSVHPDDPQKVMPYMQNPIGIGYDPYASASELTEKLMPNTEAIGDPVKSPKGHYTPQSFGPISRNFQNRMKYAGTYDDNYLEEVFPFLPPDFNPMYFQAAPLDQQIDFPKGGEQVVLTNLTPYGTTVFHLPKNPVPVEFFLGKHTSEKTEAVMDTIYIEPELGIYTVIWRASRPLKRSLFEILRIIVGKRPIYTGVRADCLNATREDFEASILIDDEDEDDDDDIDNTEYEHTAEETPSDEDDDADSVVIRVHGNQSDMLQNDE